MNLKFRMSKTSSVLISIILVGLITALSTLSNISTTDKKIPSRSAKGNVLSKSNDQSKNQDVGVVQKALVIKVVDGDTIGVEFNDKSGAMLKKTVRLIGIDSPETVHPNKPVECFGKEASQKLRAILENRNISLMSDPTQGDRDKYGRLLRYVFLENGTNVNLQMITEGYAYEYTYDEPYKFSNEFKDAQRKAEENKRGLWAEGICGN